MAQYLASEDAFNSLHRENSELKVQLRNLENVFQMKGWYEGAIASLAMHK